MGNLRILSLSTLYPNASEPLLGLFVRARLQQVARLQCVKVVAPRVFRGAMVSAAVPFRRQDQNLEVFHPRWVHPPRAGAANAAFLGGRLLPFVRNLRREYAFDVLDAHFGHPEGVAAALLSACLRVPFAITLRGNETFHAKAAGRRAALGWALRRAARIIAVSGRLREFAIELGAPPESVRIIPNGIDTSLFYPRDYAASRARLGIPAGCQAILSVGYLVENKGHHRIVRALGELRRRGSRAELWIVGGGAHERAPDFEPVIRRTIAEFGIGDAVHLAGPVKQELLPEYFSAADVFCLASSREGWPNVVHEALGCGAPAVACDVGGIPNMLPADAYGIIVPPDDQEALTAALGRALERGWDRRHIAEWGRSRSWEQVGAETAETLAEAASEAPALDAFRAEPVR